MLNFPNIKNPIYPLKHKRVDHTYKMEQDNETINTRPRFTKKAAAFYFAVVSFACGRLFPA